MRKLSQRIGALVLAGIMLFCATACRSDPATSDGSLGDSASSSSASGAESSDPASDESSATNSDSPSSDDPYTPPEGPPPGSDSPDGWSTAKALKETLPAEYSADVHKAMFSNPNARYRLNFMRHEYVSSGNPFPEDYLAMGAGGVVTNDLQTSNFLKYKGSIKKTSDRLAALYAAGLNVWIYDENGFPSGAANGLVIESDPDFESEGVSCITVTGNGKKSTSWTMPKQYEQIVTAYAVDAGGTTHNATVSGKTVSFAGVNGNWTLYIIVSSRMYEGTVAISGGYNRKLPNLLRKDAVGKFIEVGYQYYADNIKNFSDVVTAFFTDEPTLPEAIITGSIPQAKVSWSDDVEARFYDMHGYSLKTHYHSLFEGNTPQDMAVRVNYRQTTAALFAENYTGQIAEWGKKNGVITSGHLNMEEHLLWHVPNYGDLMTVLKAAGAPGGDMLTGKYANYMSEAMGNWFISNPFMAGKYVGSAARVAGKEDLVMVEICPTDTYESGYFASKNDAFAITNMLYMAGYNHINSYVQSWALNQQDGTDYTKEYLDYVGRLSYMMRNSSYDGKLGVYYPIETMQAYFTAMRTTLDDTTEGHQGKEMQQTLMTLTKNLWSKQMDYTFIDAQSILDAKISGKALVINNASFECIMMPRTEVLSVKVLEKLQKWEKAGGKLIWIEEKPHVATGLNDHAALQSAVSSVKTVSIDTAVSQAAAALTENMTVSATDIGTVYMTRHKLQDKTMYYIVNGSGKANTVQLSYSGASSLDVYDPVTGEITTHSGDGTAVKMNPYTAMFVVVN
ncbi:MAG: hypothetical protein ACLSS9_04415 [Acutalibacteraceae bacterium]